MRENFVNKGGECSATGYTYIFIDIYYWTRIVSIIVNAVVFIRISVRLHYLSRLPQLQDPNANDTTPALIALVRRMKYYPLIQVFIRRYVIQADDTAKSATHKNTYVNNLICHVCSGATWNEFNNYQYQTFASQLMNSICSPSSGACYFFLFLVRILPYFSLTIYTHTWSEHTLPTTAVVYAAASVHSVLQNPTKLVLLYRGRNSHSRPWATTANRQRLLSPRRGGSERVGWRRVRADHQPER